jgi:hypothetical protein
MKSRINLFLPELQPKLEVLTLSFVLSIWFVLLTIISLVYFLSYTQEQDILDELTAAQNQKIQLEDRLMALNESLGSRTKDPELVAAIESKQFGIRQKQRIIDELSGQEQFKSNGFAGLMNGLALNHQAGLWLTRIHLNERQVMIEGGATDSSLIPKWVSSLSLTQRFKGQEFATTKLYRDENEQLMFTLGTENSSQAQGKEQP